MRKFLPEYSAACAFQTIDNFRHASSWIWRFRTDERDLAALPWFQAASGSVVPWRTERALVFARHLPQEQDDDI